MAPTRSTADNLAVQLSLSWPDKRQPMSRIICSPVFIDRTSFGILCPVSKNQIRLAETENDSVSLLNLEKHLVQLILSEKETACAILQELDPGEFSDPALRTIAQTCRQKIDAGEDLRLDQLLDQTEDPGIKNILSRLGLEPLEFDTPERTIKECVRKFKNIRLKSKIKDLKLQRLNAANAGQVERSQELGAQLNEMYLALTH